jgi:hypothetical protein
MWLFSPARHLIKKTPAKHLFPFARQGFSFFYQFNIGLGSSHVIPQCIDDIFLLYLTDGIQHCDENDQEYAQHTDCHTTHGNTKARSFNRSADTITL